MQLRDYLMLELKHHADEAKKFNQEINIIEENILIRGESSEQ